MNRNHWHNDSEIGGTKRTELATFEENEFPVGLGVWDMPRSRQFVQIASGYSRVITGFLKGQYLFIGDQQPFQTVEPFEYQKIVHFVSFWIKK